MTQLQTFTELLQNSNADYQYIPMHPIWSEKGFVDVIITTEGGKEVKFQFENEENGGNSLNFFTPIISE